MRTYTAKQELLREVDHDHYHFERMFADLKEVFRRVVMQEVSFVERPDILETAIEDLSFLIEEMIQHFEKEEEIIFQFILEKYPQYDKMVDHLQKGHDAMCVDLCHLKSLLSQEIDQVENSGMSIYESLLKLQRAVDMHSKDENELFIAALNDMECTDCEFLRDSLKDV